MKQKKKQIFIFAALCAVICAGSIFLSSFAVSGKKSTASSVQATQTDAKSAPVVYFTRTISPDSLVSVYNALNRPMTGNVAVKISTGEPGGNYYLHPDLIKELVQSVNGTIVECNTAYGGQRAGTAMHRQVAVDHGFAAIAPVDIMDADGEIAIPFPSGKNIQEDFIGSHFTNYDSFIILSHFKGHAMGGFGGAIKNMSIGIASSGGKLWIHSSGTTKTDMGAAFGSPHDLFLESMAEASGAVMKKLGKRVVYINVMNNLSVDCDCDSHPAKPEMGNVGILASLDPVALDKACVDQVYAYPDRNQSAALRERMESRNGIHTLDHAAELGLGSESYRLVTLDD